ncbi:MAG TPA: hypothetical protein VIJ72_02835 [Rhizomicrobium sp.]
MAYFFSPEAVRMRKLAIWIRARARETGWPEYGWKFRRAAKQLEEEAAERERRAFYNSLFGSPSSIIALSR